MKEKKVKFYPKRTMYGTPEELKKTENLITAISKIYKSESVTTEQKLRMYYLILTKIPKLSSPHMQSALCDLVEFYSDILHIGTENTGAGSPSSIFKPNSAPNLKKKGGN